VSLSVIDISILTEHTDHFMSSNHKTAVHQAGFRKIRLTQANMHVSTMMHTLLCLVLRKVRSNTTTKLSRSAHLRLHIEIERLCLSEVKNNILATHFSDGALNSRWTIVLVSLELVVSGI
jgi:hypothetical protein